MNAHPASTEVRDFLRHLADERQLSGHTVAAYQLDLRQLCEFLTEYLGHSMWSWADEDVDRLALRGFLGWLGRKEMSKRTIARKLSATRALFGFLHAEDRIPSNPASAIRAPKAEKTLPGHLTRGDVSAVFAEAERRAEQNTLSSARDLVILELLYGSGLRLSELHGVDLESIDRDAKLVRVMGKGRKERIVPVSEAALRAIAHYEPRREEIKGRADDALLVNARGGRLSRRSIQTAVSACF